MLRIVLAASLLLAGPAVLADDAPRASLHYSDLKGYLDRLDGLKDLDHLTAAASIKSAQAAVKPQDIKLTAKLKSGQAVDIPIDSDGRFTLPSSPELEKEDPLFVSNQPKGTLGLNVKFDIKTPTRLSDTYASLMLGATQFNEAIRRQGFMASMFGPKVGGLLIAFDSGGHTLTLHTTKGDRVLKSASLAEAQKHLKSMKLTEDSGKRTFIYVPLDDDLLDEDPPAVLDALPTGVIPAI
ncbi:MAG TPA: DUF2987 domain-containing protein [Gammaproteobacteria bacterium]